SAGARRHHRPVAPTNRKRYASNGMPTCHSQSSPTGLYTVWRRICSTTQRVKHRPMKPQAPRLPLSVSTVCPGVVSRAASSSTAPKCTSVGVLKARMVVIASGAARPVSPAVRAQAVGPAPALTGATAAWTLKLPGGGEIRWQQVTPAGVLLVSTDAALAGVEIERGVVAWQKPELGGLPADSVRMVEGSLLMEAARPGLLVVFDPVTGATVFDSRKLSLTQVVTR